MSVQIYALNICTRSGWDGINLLQSSQYGAAFYIGDQNNVENTPIF